jgi:hypothetical protein
MLIDIGILSVYPILKVVSHKDERDKRGYHLFSRHCLEVRFRAREMGFLKDLYVCCPIR